MAEQSSYLNLRNASDERLFFTLLGLSLLGHVVFFIFDKASFITDREPLFEEWEVEAELLPDINISAPDKSALPNAEQAENERVADNLLPQLPKKFTLQESTTEEEAISETDEKPKDQPDEAAKPAAETVKAAPVKPEEQVNKMAMADALKRLALEKLRAEQKTAEKNTAEESDSAARLKRDDATEDKVNKGSTTGLSAAAQKIYRSKLRAHIGKFWSVPEAYNLKDANLRVTVMIRVNEQGNLMESSVQTPSGDSVFDDMAFNAVKNSAPLPLPPVGQAGEEILLNFTPKSF